MSVPYVLSDQEYHGRSTLGKFQPTDPATGLPAVDLAGNPIYGNIVAPMLSSGGHTSVVTAANGTSYTAFAAQPCKQLTIGNDTGVQIDVLQGGTGSPFPVFAGTYLTFFGLTDASQLSVRRDDTSTTTVTVKARWEG